MGSGVPKSGSPAPKSITSMPDRRSLSTAAPTAIVADVAILDVRSANRTIVSPVLRPHRLLFPEPLLDQLRHKSVHLAAEREHFFDQPRADERVLRGRHHEHGFECAGQLAVHQR